MFSARLKVWLLGGGKMVFSQKHGPVRPGLHGHAPYEHAARWYPHRRWYSRCFVRMRMESKQRHASVARALENNRAERQPETCKQTILWNPSPPSTLTFPTQMIRPSLLPSRLHDDTTVHQNKHCRCACLSFVCSLLMEAGGVLCADRSSRSIKEMSLSGNY